MAEGVCRSEEFSRLISHRTKEVKKVKLTMKTEKYELAAKCGCTRIYQALCGIMYRIGF